MNPKGNPQNLVRLTDATRNKAGRPKKDTTFTQILKELGDLKDINHKGELIQRKSALGFKLWEMAIKGDIQAIRYIYDRVDGTPIPAKEEKSDFDIVGIVVDDISS